MTKRQNIFMEIFSILFFSISLLLVSSNQTFAAERQKTFLQVSPSTQQLGGLQPGETREGSFKVQNVGSGAFDFKVYASSYEVKSMTRFSTEKRTAQKLPAGLHLARLLVILNLTLK